MTKKSYARQMRDEDEKQLRNNTSWTDLAQIQNACLSALQMHTTLAQQLLDSSLTPFYRDYKSVTINMGTLATDLQRISSAYLAISSKHVGKTGSSANHVELMESLKLGGEYAALHEEMNNTLAPTAIFLSEELGFAVQARDDAARSTNMTPEQDPSVISDVEVKTA